MGADKVTSSLVESPPLWVDNKVLFEIGASWPADEEMRIGYVTIVGILAEYVAEYYRQERGLPPEMPRSVSAEFKNAMMVGDQVAGTCEGSRTNAQKHSLDVTFISEKRLPGSILAMAVLQYGPETAQ